MMAMAFVEFENVSKIYKTGEVEISALHGASFTVEQGEICVIVGASGAGKTTLLNILGGMDTLTSGTVKLDGRDISRYNRRQLIVSEDLSDLRIGGSFAAQNLDGFVRMLRDAYDLSVTQTGDRFTISS